METRDKDTVQFYYDRDRRLAKAGVYAQFAESLHGAKRPGFFRTMTATRSLKFLFFTLIIVVISSFIVDWVSGSRNRGSMGGYVYVLDALWFEGDVYLSIARTEGRGSRAAAPVDIAMSVGEAVGPGLLTIGMTEYKSRLSAPDKPQWAAAILTQGDSRIELAARVR
ncbi:MAG: hypothetical protein E4H20_06440 [Spirochaetales bacterium]|nr:MAG: hypothetical protein E4H20_06440 [Spirochaetales bacterium]